MAKLATAGAATTTTTSDERRAQWLSRLATALRAVLACSIVGGITLYGPATVKRQLAFPAFSYATSILIVTDATLGDAMRGCWYAICAIVQGSLPAILSLWVIGPARLTASTTAVAVGVSAFVVTLPKSTHLLCKRIALGQIVLVYVVAFLQGGATDVVMHPFHVAASTAVGASASILALLFPYPRLACYKVKKKCTLFAENASERLSLYVLALCSQDEPSALTSLSQAQSLSKTGAKLLQSIKLKQESIQWETSQNRFLQLHNHNPGEIVQSLEIPLRGMEIAITCCRSFPVEVVDSELQSLLQRLEEHIRMALRHTKCCPSGEYSSTVPETNESGSSPHVVTHPPHLTHTKCSLPSEYSSPVPETKESSSSSHVVTIPPNLTPSMGYKTPSQWCIKYSNSWFRYCLGGMKWGGEGNSTPHMGRGSGLETNREEVDKSLHTLKTIFPSSEDLPSLFFLFCMTVLYDESVTTQWNKGAKGKNSVIKSKEEANSDKQDCFSRLIGLLRGLPLKMSSERLVFALKCSLSLGLAVLFGLAFNKEQSYWSGLTVGLGIASAGEATFKVANRRAQGTVLGSIYGVLGCFLSQRFMAIRFLSLLPWIIITCFLRHSQIYGEGGGISAVIAALLILGRKNYGPPSEFAFARIMETFIGLFCYVLVEILLQPTRAATLAKIQLSHSLGTLYECIESISLSTSHESNSMFELKEKQEKLRTQVNELGEFIAEAEAEPNFWFLPFHGACYGKLLGSLSNMMELLVLVVRAIDLLPSESRKGLLEQIDVNIEVFKKMVCSSINCCEEITSMKSLATLEKEITAKNISCDIELGRSPNLDQSKLLSTNDDEIEKILRSFLRNSKEVTEKIDAGKGDDRDEEHKSQVVLCLSALWFCMERLMKETREIAMGVKELVQWENPSSQVNLHEIYCKIQSTRKVL